MLELFFKYPVSVWRKGELLFASGWPLWLLLALIAAAGGFLWWNLAQSPNRLSVRRKVVLWGLQTAMAALALLLLWRPALGIQSLRNQQNVVSVLLDASRSMGLAENGKSRLDQSLEALPAVVQGLSEKFAVRLYSFSSDVDRMESLADVPAPGSSSRIGESVAAVLRESAAAPLGAVIVVSDGSDNSGTFNRELMAEIRKRNVPVHTVGVGREKIPNDLELADVVVAPKALPKSQVSAQATIRHDGSTGKTRLTVRDGSKILASKDIELRPNEPSQVEWIDFPAGDPGLRDLRFAIDPLPGEEITGNNAQARVMDVPRGSRSVLYVEGEPRWEYKFMRRALTDDPSVRLVSLLRTSANKYYRQGVDHDGELEDGFPLKAEELFAYDGLIIGSFEAAFFSPEQQRMIREFVNRRGGSLLMLGGKRGLSDGGWDASQTADAFPVSLTGLNANTFTREKAAVRLTARGADSLICRLDGDPAKNAELWKEMPQVADYQLLGDMKPAAVSLLEVQAGAEWRPLLVSQSFGRGKALVFATGGSWRWKMQLPHEDERHFTFWRQLIRGLAANSPGPVTLTSDRSLYADDPRVKLRAEVRTKEYEIANNATVTATITPEKGEPLTVEMFPAPNEEGVYLAETTATQPGSYRVEAKAFLGDDALGSALLHIRREDGVAEDFQPAQNRQLLERLSEQTGGRYWTLSELAGLPEEVRFSEAGITARENLDLWDMPALFLLLLGLKSSEWLLRRKWGTI
ncbi:MAG: hypothetical protein GC160_06335 [Acidobacteria bacterium]|nr:hypothetical protein [Acidobacteriota bacterium]